MSRRFLVPPTLPTGTSNPASGNVGDLFFRTDELALYVFTSTGWMQVGMGQGDIDGGVPDQYYGWLGLGLDGGHPNSELPTGSGVDAGGV